MIDDLWNLIVILFEICVILLLLDGMFWILGKMFSISWKKILMAFGTIFGILWLHDHFKRKGDSLCKGVEMDNGE